MDFEELNYLSLAGGVGAVLFSIMLPRVLRDVEEEKARKSGDQNDPEQPINQGEKDAENDEEGENFLKLNLYIKKRRINLP